MLEEILETLRPQPRTINELSNLLNLNRNQVESALRQLQRGGFVDKAIPDQGACYTGCAFCSVKNFCPTYHTPQLGQETWRLTDKALSRVSPSA